MNSKWVLRKGQDRLSHIFARKEHQLSTPPALKSDTTCSQFKLLPGYLIKHSWDTVYCLKHIQSNCPVPIPHSSMAKEIINNGHCNLSFLSAQSFYSGLAPCTLPRWEGLCSCAITMGAMSRYPGGPQLQTFSSEMWHSRDHLCTSVIWSCEDVYKKVALPCSVTLISISGASKGFSGSHSKPNSVENRILLALHPVPSQNLKLNSQLKLKLELFLEKPAAPCLCSHPAFCCSDWDYFTSTSERIFQSREEQTKIK